MAPEVAPLKVKTVPDEPVKQSPVEQSPTALTSPVSVKVGVAQVASPLQKVDEEAEVPLFKLVTGKLPVTAVVKLTLVNVLDKPLMDLLVKASVVALPTKVSVASGKVKVLAVVKVDTKVPVTPVVPLTSTFSFLVLSVESTTKLVESDKDLLVKT